MIDISYPKKKIIWLTADYFLDCDVEIIRNLSFQYNIHWHIILPRKGSRYNEYDINQWKLSNVEISIHWNKYRLRDPLSLLFFVKLFKQIKRKLYDILYLNYTPSPFFTLATVLFLKKNNVIATAHQGKIHEGFKFKFIYWFSYGIFYSYFSFVNMFSESETAKFIKAYPKSIIFTIPLALKSYGVSNFSQSQDRVEFFNFGTIRANKNIGCLIEAACNLYEKGIKGFHVVIKGECENWEQYSQKIKFPELFTCDIRLISNEEIADIFSQYHYLVLPYSAVSQSGPIKIAFNYNIPVIASDLEGFKLDIEDGINGYLFKNKDVFDLEIVLKKAIENHSDKYESLRNAQKKFVEKYYSFKSIVEKYQEMFESVSKLIDSNI